MKNPVKFGANFAVIGGKRVPYSLLGAVAAILGAVLIWAQFKNSGGIAIGGQSPDLSTLNDALAGGDSGGGTPGLDTSAEQQSAVDLGGAKSLPSYSYYVPSLSQPTPIYTGYSGSLATAAAEPAAIGANPALTTGSGSGGGPNPSPSTSTATAGPSLIAGIAALQAAQLTKYGGAPLPPSLIPGKTGGATKF